MKILSNVLLFLLVSLLYVPVASAQNGAVIIRGEGDVGLIEWNGESVLAVLSSDLGFYCEDELDITPFEWMDVVRPDGSIKFHEKGNLFARVYYPATPDDFWLDPCDFIENGPMVAEGITHFTYNDNDATNAHPNRQNTWGYTLNGSLYDLAGFCGDGMVDLNIVRRFKFEKNCEGDCVVPQVLRGPFCQCKRDT